MLSLLVSDQFVNVNFISRQRTGEPRTEGLEQNLYRNRKGRLKPGKYTPVCLEEMGFGLVLIMCPCACTWHRATATAKKVECLHAALLRCKYIQPPGGRARLDIQQHKWQVGGGQDQVSIKSNRAHQQRSVRTAFTCTQLTREITASVLHLPD